MNSQVFCVVTEVMLMAIVICLILLVVALILVVIIHVCIVGRAFRRGFGAGATLERGNTGGSSMSRNDLEKLPCYDYISNGRASSSPVDCAVCLDNFKDGEKCRMLPICRHSFHSQCVDAWLLRAPSCPICRTSADSSSHFSDSSIDLRESLATRSNQSSETRIDIRETGDSTQSQEGSTHFNNAITESIQNQIESVGTRLNSNTDSESQSVRYGSSFVSQHVVS